MKPPRPESVDLGKGAKGYFAADVDGRVLWAVRFPAHSCYSTTKDADPNTPTTYHCEVGSSFPSGYAPQSFRHGKAANEEEARRAMSRAVAQGRPTAATADSQFVQP